MDSAGVSIRLFEIYTQINDREKAAEIWPFIPQENRESEKYLEDYFSVQKKLDNDAVSDSVAHEILKLNPENVDALEWLATRYYHMAEDRYQREMKKYEKNHTHMQHFRLTQQLLVVTEDFKKSQSYFKTLWKMKQDPRYATYLVNIYTRFEEPAKADYYRKFVK